MAYEVLARKWRPHKFEDVVGQAHITQTLVNAIRNERLAHAYLFSGPRGVGKTSVARILAKAINCLERNGGDPCNRCVSCLEITSGASVDVQEIDGASNRGIDEIRELRENIRYMPSSSRYRVYIIDEVHMLTLPAFNALLKTLEEPPAHVKFIFATTEAHKVPATILSRCQRFDFKRIARGPIIQHLERITAHEGISVTRSALSHIARKAEGSMRDAESLLDQVIAYTGPSVEDRYVDDILGIVDRALVFDGCRAVIEGDEGRCFDIVDQVYNAGHDIKEFYRALTEAFRNLLVSLVTSDPHLIADLAPAELEETRALAEKAGSEKLHAILSFLIRREEDLRYTGLPRVILETTLIRLCRIGDLLSVTELLDKLEGMERRLLEGAMGAVAPPPTVGKARPKSVDQTHAPVVTEKSGAIPWAGSWGEFMAFLGSRNRAMANVLKDWQFVQLTGETLEIASGEQSFSSTYFDDPEKLKGLTAYCREFFGRDLTIKILTKGPTQAEGKMPAQASSCKPAHDTPSDLPHPVQEVLQIFQGRVEPLPAQDGADRPMRDPSKREVEK
jgi:DNA polymerase-3 subunit gamma/tau